MRGLRTPLRGLPEHTADALDKCPECGRKRLERLIGAGAGVIFKGSGFYQTDYKQPAGGDARTDNGPAKDSPAQDGPAKDGAKGGGCTPACGTKDAPAGCAQNKTAPNKTTLNKKKE